MGLPAEVYDSPVRVEWKLLAALRSDAPSITNTELAKRLGVNINTVTRWTHDQEYQRYETWVLTKNFEALPVGVRTAYHDVQDEFLEGSSEMQDRLRHIIEMTGDPKLEAELCQDWLDRAGFAPLRKVASQGPRQVVLTGEAVEVFFRRAAEAGLHQVAGVTNERSDEGETG